MLVTNTVGSQIQGMNSSIVKMQEMNEKMKEEGENGCNQLNERITNMERRILDINEKYENRSEDNKKDHVGENQGKTEITGFHSETTESEVTQLLREMINEIGMDFGSGRIECSAKPITHAFIHFMNDGDRNKFIRSANMLRKELRVLHSYETQHSSQLDLLELDLKIRVSQRTDCGENMQKWISQVQQIPRC